ncbi:hypothetical protein LXL04_023084 [Taraxacum kok-saghyz]
MLKSYKTRHLSKMITTLSCIIYITKIIFSLGKSPTKIRPLNPCIAREVIDEEGWLHTGDIGLWAPGGRLKIIDRKKNIFKLAQGEYIAPEKIEYVYVKSKYVAQCFVYGDSFNSSLVVVVSVDPDMLKAFAAKEGIKVKTIVVFLEQLCNDPRARTAVLADMDAIGKEAQVTYFFFLFLINPHLLILSN